MHQVRQRRFQGIQILRGVQKLRVRDVETRGKMISSEIIFIQDIRCEIR
jgi:hypothetical protein